MLTVQQSDISALGAGWLPLQPLLMGVVVREYRKVYRKLYPDFRRILVW
jgi:hypothetical protein